MAGLLAGLWAGHWPARRTMLLAGAVVADLSAAGVGFGLKLLSVAALEGFGLPVPAEILLVAAPAAGFAAPGALALATGGYLLGAVGAYWGGRLGGSRVVEGLCRLLGWQSKEGEQLAALFRRWGALAGFFARFIPPLRAVTLWSAGALGVDFGRFLLATGLSTLLWNGAWLTVGLSLLPLIDPYLMLVWRWSGWAAAGVGTLLILRATFRQLGTRHGRGIKW
jgi:membrane protein DedA with SNARE-associated domain